MANEFDQFPAIDSFDQFPVAEQSDSFDAFPVAVAEPPPEAVSDNLLGRFAGALSANTMAALQGAGRILQQTPLYRVPQMAADVAGIGEYGPRRGFDAAIGVAREIQDRSREDYGVTTQSDTLPEQLVEAAATLPLMIAGGPAAPGVNAALMGELQRQDAELNSKSTVPQWAMKASFDNRELTPEEQEQVRQYAARAEAENLRAQDVSFAAGAGMGALTEWGLGVPAMLRGGGGRRILDTIGLGGAREGSQEGLQQYGSNVIAKLLYDPERELSEGVKESIGIGGMIGAPVGPLMQGPRKDSTGIQAEDVSEPDLSKFGSKARESSPMESLLTTEQPASPPPLPVSPTEQAAASVLGQDPVELRQQEAIITGQPVPGVEELERTQQEQRAWLEENYPEAPETAPSEAVEAPLAPEDGPDTTQPPEGLVAVDSDTYERLADEPIREGWVGYQDPDTLQVFQVPEGSLPEVVQQRLQEVRAEESEAYRVEREAQLERELMQQRFDENVQKYLVERTEVDPILRKDLLSSDGPEVLWNDVDRLKFQLDRQEMNLKRAQAGMLKDTDGTPVKPQDLEKGVQALRERYQELQGKIVVAKDAFKGMKKGPKNQGAINFTPVFELGATVYRKGMAFADWSKQMVKHLGSQVRPFLVDLWSSVVSGVNALSPAGRRFKRSGSVGGQSPQEVYDVFAEDVADATTDTQPNQDFGEADKQAVKDAYTELRAEKGFAGVSIADVMERAGYPLSNQSKGLIMQMYRDGEITSLNLGDWSLASSRERAWGVRNLGDRFLTVTMPAGMQRSAPSPEGGAIGSQGGRRQAVATTATPEAYSKGQMARSLSRFWLGQYGAFPKEIRDVMERKNMMQDGIIANGRVLGADLQAEIKAASKRTKIPQDLLKEETSKALEEQPHQITDPDLLEAITKARRFIDAMSTAAMGSGAVKGYMVDTFRSNMGKWLRRYYNAFDQQANWNYDALVKRAWKDGIKRKSVKDSRIAKIITDAEAVLRRENPGINEAQMEGLMRSLTDRTELANAMFGGANTKVRKEVSSLIRRKEIPEAIRKLMGEERNPILRYEKSIQFMSQLLAKHEAQKALRDIGLQIGLFSPEQVGRYSVQMSEESDTLDVLGGLYTTPEMKAALEESDAYAAQVKKGVWALGLFARFGAEAKMAKVALNPNSWSTNFIGAVLMNAGNGVVPLSSLRSAKMHVEAAQIMRSGRGMTARDRKKDVTQRLRDMRARLIAEGVYNSNVALSDLEASLTTASGDYLERFSLADAATGAARLGYYGKEFGEAIGGPPGAIAGGVAGGLAGAAIGGKRVTKGVQTLASKAIGSPDNYFKIVGFLDEFETYKRANPNMPDAEVAKIAAENVKNTRPTYAKVPAGLKTISRYGFMQSFFQFNYEMFRNTFHTAALAQREIRSGNPVLQVKGAKRAAGLAVLVGLTAPPLLKIFSQIFSGLTDEQQKAFQESFAAPWDKVTNLLFVEPQKKGNVAYMNPSYLVPHNQIMKGIAAIFQGGNPQEIADRVFETYVEDFFQAGIHVTPFIEASVNRKNMDFTTGTGGSPITKREDATGWLDRVDYVLDKTVRPGAADKAQRLALAARQQRGEYGKEYSLEEEFKRSAGLRVNNYDLKQSLYFRLADVSSKSRTAQSVVTSAQRRGVSPDRLQSDVQYSADKRAQYKAEVRKLVADARVLGVREADIRKAIKDAKLPVALRP